MEVSIPGQTNQFEIPDDWWVFAEMEGFRPSGGGYYPLPAGIDFDVVPIAEVEPPARNQGVRAFDKFRLMPVLFAFRSPECALPAAPGGGGKTLIASAIASGFRALGLRVLFVVPAIELVDQTLEKFYRGTSSAGYV
jgi:Type III restriction enzyme, res subunit